MHIFFLWNWNDRKLQAGSVGIVLIEIRPKKEKDKQDFNIREQTQYTTCEKKKTSRE